MLELVTPFDLVDIILTPGNVLLFITALVPIAGMIILVYDQLDREQAISIEIVHWSFALLLISTIVIMGVKGRLGDPAGTGLVTALIGFVLGQITNLDR